MEINKINSKSTFQKTIYFVKLNIMFFWCKYTDNCVPQNISMSSFISQYSLVYLSLVHFDKLPINITKYENDILHLFSLWNVILIEKSREVIIDVFEESHIKCFVYNQQKQNHGFCLDKWLHRALYIAIWLNMVRKRRMKFNRQPYTLSDWVLQQVDKIKYIGIRIRFDVKLSVEQRDLFNTIKAIKCGTLDLSNCFISN